MDESHSEDIVEVLGVGLSGGTLGVASKTRIILRPLPDWTTPVNNKQKKALIRFVLAGIVGLVIHKAEEVINDKTDERFPDEDSDQEDN